MENVEFVLHEEQSHQDCRPICVISSVYSISEEEFHSMQDARSSSSILPVEESPKDLS